MTVYCGVFTLPDTGSNKDTDKNGLLPPANEVWGQGNVFTPVCHSVHRGQGGLPTWGGSTSRGGLYPGGFGQTLPGN